MRNRLVSFGSHEPPSMVVQKSPRRFRRDQAALAHHGRHDWPKYEYFWPKPTAWRKITRQEAEAA